MSTNFRRSFRTRPGGGGGRGGGTMGVLRRKSANSRSKLFEDQYERPTVQHFPANEICFSCGCILLDDLSSGSWRWKITSPCHVLLYIYMMQVRNFYAIICVKIKIWLLLLRGRGERKEIGRKYLHRFEREMWQILRQKIRIGCNVWNGMKFNWKFC